jgi:hypothetical protein
MFTNLLQIGPMSSGDITGYIANFDWNNPSWDLFIVLFFLIGAFLYGVSLGRDRIIVILVSIYIALALVHHTPFIGSTAEIAIEGGFAFQLTAFLGLFLVLFFLLSRSALSRTIAARDSHGRWYQVFIFGIFHVGLMTSIVLSFLPAEFLDKFSWLTQQIFVSDIGKFFWLFAPLVAMGLTKGKRKRRAED